MKFFATLAALALSVAGSSAVEAPESRVEYIAQSVCMGGLATGLGQARGSSMSLVLAMYIPGSDLHSQCKAAIGKDWHACGVARPNHPNDQDCKGYTLDYDFEDRRPQVPQSDKASLYTSFVTARHFNKKASEWKNCNSANTLICCSPSCEGW